MAFEDEKKRYMDALHAEEYSDASKKGSVDVDALPLLDAINSLNQYYSTSSCAGRITLFAEPTSGKKQDGHWLLASHQYVDIVAVEKALEDVTSFDLVLFQQETCILHICARTLEDAQVLVDLAKFHGFKRSGIMSTRKRIMVELLSTERVETIVAKQGERLADKNYIMHLVELANTRLKRTREKMKKFESALRALGSDKTDDTQS